MEEQIFYGINEIHTFGPLNEGMFPIGMTAMSFEGEKEIVIFFTEEQIREMSRMYRKFKKDLVD